MTQEEKKLLFKELCARLAYGVKVKVECTTANGKKIEDEGTLNSIFINEFGTIYVCVDEVEYELEHIKPYLRPMSSMTEEEKRELQSFFPGSLGNQWLDVEAGYIDIYECESTTRLYLYDANRLIDWLNKKMFDFRGLIPKDLALSTDEFNPYKN